MKNAQVKLDFLRLNFVYLMIDMFIFTKQGYIVEPMKPTILLGFHFIFSLDKGTAFVEAVRGPISDCALFLKGRSKYLPFV